MPCSDHKDCITCDLDDVCHWCPDGQCHTYLSPQGCFQGVDCASLYNCTRPQPVFAGYQTPPAKAGAQGFGIGLGMFLLLMSVFGIIAYILWLRKIKRNPSSNTSSSSGAIELTDEPGSTYPRTTQSPSVVKQHADTCRGYCCATRTLSIFWGVAITFSMLVLIGTAVAAAYLYPQKPGFSTCGSSILWGTVINGMLSDPFNPQALVEMQFSIYNPNRFDITVVKGTGTFHWADMEIGRGYAMGIVFPAGSVIDYFANVTFQMSFSEALNMAADESDGDLFVSVELDLDVSIAWSSVNLIQLGQSVEVSVNVNQPNKDLCLCPNIPPTPF